MGMSQKNIGMGLIIFGILILLLAFNMSVSVEGSDVVNLYMISERQNTLVFGGIVFLGGIILFALARLKQTEAEDAIEKSKQHDRSEKFKNNLGQVNTAASGFYDSLSDVWSKFFVTWNDNIIGRIAVGLFVGSCAWYLSDSVYFMAFLLYFSVHLIDISWFVFLAFAFAYSMRSIPSSKVILHLLIFNVITISLSMAVAVDLFSYWGRTVVVLSVPLVLSCLVIWFIKAREMKYAKMATSSSTVN